MMLQLHHVMKIPAFTHIHENNCSCLDHVGVTRIVVYARTGMEFSDRPYSPQVSAT